LVDDEIPLSDDLRSEVCIDVEKSNERRKEAIAIGNG